ncbi:hypothetical protein T07_7533 [Trichinella nelsoni]|uniref:Uncharacterized protein n=1 Tax=Trichinella nelsoni TaxID=6336 RepID=A0A0V0SFU8_9BILA|nr:hypothetical protein T07_7533 [Trichinella nelsoni]
MYIVYECFFTIPVKFFCERRGNRFVKKIRLLPKINQSYSTGKVLSVKYNFQMRYTGGRDVSMSRALDAPALAILFPYRILFLFLSPLYSMEKLVQLEKYARTHAQWTAPAFSGVERADVGRHLQAVKQASNQAKKAVSTEWQNKSRFSFACHLERSSFAGNRIVSRWAVIDDDRPSSLLVTATSCWTQRANRFQFTLDKILVGLFVGNSCPPVCRPSTASSTPCYCKAVAQQRAKFKPAHAAGPRPVMTSRRKQDRPRRVGVDRHRFRHKKDTQTASKHTAHVV